MVAVVGREAPSSLADARRDFPGSASPPRIYRIEGGRPLQGTIRLGGAKNAASKQIIASLLTDEPSTIAGVPRIREIDQLLRMLAEVGTVYQWLDHDTLRIHTPSLSDAAVGGRHARHNRLPVLLLSCLLHRAGCARVPQPGGCPIGTRPVDFHLRALEAMGAKIGEEQYGFTAEARGLRGAVVRLPYPSVGATEIALLAAVLARGTTVILNAAIEPEVIDTVQLLRKMGASIRRGSRRTMIVEGVARLRGARHRVMGDRIEAASFAAAAAATEGIVRIEGARSEPLRGFLRTFQRLGGGFRIEPEAMVFYRRWPALGGVQVETAPYPAFSTDWLPPLVPLLLQAGTPSVVHETVFEGRLEPLLELTRMGARLRLSTDCLGSRPCRFHGPDHFHSGVVYPSPLHGARLTVPDLRAGFACLIAALGAEGTSEIAGIARLERGYGELVTRLRQLGAAIEEGAGGKDQGLGIGDWNRQDTAARIAP